MSGETLALLSHYLLATAFLEAGVHLHFIVAAFCTMSCSLMGKMVSTEPSFSEKLQRSPLVQADASFSAGKVLWKV